MKCQVCQTGKVCGHNHYGCSCICHSCRAFFMRAVQSKLYQVFQHGKSQDCIIDSQKRKSCKKCRFEKCLDVGMKIAFVQAPRVSSEHLKLSTSTLKADEEKSLIHAYHKAMDNCSHEFYDIYARNPDLAMDHYGSNHFERILSDREVENMYRLDKYGLRIMAKTLAFHDGRCNKHFDLLYDHNFERIKNVIYGLLFNNQRWSMEHQESFAKYRHIWKLTNDESALIIELIEKNVRPTIEYEAFHSSPWASNAEIEDEHCNLHKSVSNWFVQAQGDDGPFVFSVMFMILLFNSDGLIVEEKAKIEETQQNYVNLLHKYLKSRLSSNDANHAFHKGLMLIHETQRIHELSMKRLQLDLDRNLSF